MKPYLKCKIALGLFTGEVGVRGTAHGGAEFSLFVPEEFVDFDTVPSGSATVDGWIRVEVLASDRDLLLVQLPQQTFENGITVTVPKSQVEHRNPRELA